MTREMKNSGIEWIGQIPADWNIGRVKNAFTRKNEKAQQEEPTILSLARSGVKVRDVSTGEGQIAESYYNYNPVEPFDLLLNPMDLYSGANCSISKVSGVISPAYINLKANDNYYPVFYDYYFKTQYWAMAFFAHGKGVSYDNRWTLSAETLMNYYIPVPPFTEQKKIADFLDSKVSEIDKMITETKSSIENYKEYKQSVITEAVTKGLDKDVLMKDSGIEWIGQIPADWEVRKMKSFSKMISKGTTPKDMKTEIDTEYCIRYLKSENIVSNNLNIEPEFSITEEINEELKRSQLKKDDILFVIAGASIGKTAIVPEEFLPANTNQAVSFIRLEKDFLDYKKYIWYFLQSRILPTVIALYSVQSAQPNLSMENLGNIKLAISKNKAEIFEIVNYLDEKMGEIDNLISEKEALVSNLEEYKKSLIYEYVTGKKEVSVAGKNENVVVVAPIYPAFYKTKKARFAQAVLMSKILDTSNNNKGRVKLEKTLYTIEHHIGFDFETEYTRDAAGPLDNSLYKCETIISSINKWFNISSSNYGVSYKPTKNVNKYKNYYNNYFADYNTEIERIIGIFDNFDTDQAEIIATLYGAWNDFVIDNKTYTDEDVVNEVLNNWHDSKKRFAKDVWLRAMDKMRTLDLIPKGYGKKTIYKEV